MTDAEQITYINEIIVKGGALSARKHLAQRLAIVTEHPLGPAHRVAFAGLCRRAGRSEWGVRLLNPILRADLERVARASDEEKCEYGACLSQLGAVDEALRILSTVEANDAPQSLLFRAFCLFSRWSYAESLPLLKRYVSILAARTPGAYSLRVGQINLASALQFSGLQTEAEALCREVIASAAQEGLLLLQGNACEILGRALIELGDWQAGENALAESKRLLSRTGTVDFLFIRKWDAVLCLKRYGVSRERILALEAIRDEAIESSNWENARDCDFHLGALSGDRALLRKVYFGTPYAEYRARVLSACKETSVAEAEIREGRYVWPHGEVSYGNGRCQHTIDVQNGSCSCGRSHFKPDQLLHRLLKTLSADLYRPQSTASLFGALYLGESYNPASSPLRVRQAIKRFRTSARRARISLALVESRSCYHFAPSGSADVALAVPESQSSARLAVLWDSLSAREEFSAEHAAGAWGVSPRYARTQLAALVEAGLLTQLGTTRGCRFRRTTEHLIWREGDPRDREEKARTRQKKYGTAEDTD